MVLGCEKVKGRLRAALGVLILKRTNACILKEGDVVDNMDTVVKALPEIILDEIFCLSNRVNDVVIDHLCSDIEHCGYTMQEVLNFDCSIIFKVTANNGHIIAEIRIDRIFKTFEIAGKANGFTILPGSGSWDDILNYLSKLNFYYSSMVRNVS